MNKQDFAKFFKSVGSTLSKHSPEILTGVGIAGMITAGILAVKATPKALKLIEEKKQEYETDKLTPVDTVKATWKCYIPAVVTGAASTACLIGANSVHARRGAALATAYKISETALAEYKEKMVEAVGEKKAQLVQDKINQEKVEKNPPVQSQVIVTGNGTTRCLDSLSGRYFESSRDAIEKAANELNRVMLIHEYVSLNEFYDEIGLAHIDLGYDLGWNVSRGLIKLDFGATLPEDGIPTVVVNYEIAPKYDYDKFS